MSLNLYDILNNVLNESVNQNSVINAIDSKNRVFIDYSDEDNNAPGRRLIEPYALGITKAGNLALRAFQYQGATLRGIPKWKLFRLDRINKWTPLKSHFNLPPNEQGFDSPAYNERGDNTLVSVIKQVSFGKNNDLYQPSLDKERKRTDMVKNHANAMDLSNLETMPKGPIVQKKNNIFTSRPNSKKYAEYRKNVMNTQRDATETEKYWGDYDKAEQERINQQIQNKEDDEMNNYRGPVKDFDDDENDYENFIKNGSGR